MLTRYVSAATLIGLCAAALLVASTSAAPAVNYNSSKSNTGNVYFRDLSPKGQGVLRSLCAAHKACRDEQEGPARMPSGVAE